jgi:CarD family transcriptional regulator
MNEMAQKKKVLSASKATEKPAVRKAAPAKAAPAAAKPVVKAKAAEAPRKPAPAPVAPVKAKAAAPAPAKAPAKKAPLPVKAEAKPAPVAQVAAAAKKPAAPVAAVVAATAKPAAAAPAQRAVPAAVQKPVGQKLTAPVAAPAQPAQTPRALAEKAAAARQILAAQKKPVNQRHGFKANEFIVYPAHGVGRIVGIEEQEIAGMSLELFVINFEKEKLTLRVPTGKLESVGMRKLADDAVVKKSMEILKGRARIKRTMWSRRAQEYVAKINSGDLVSIAEVVRDLYRSEAQPEQSYSERQLYEDALDRMAREIAAVEKLDERGAVQRITDVLSKSAKSRRLAGEGEPAVGEAA